MHNKYSCFAILLFSFYITGALSQEIDEARGEDIKILARYPGSVRIEYDFLSEADEYYREMHAVGPTYYIVYKTNDNLDTVKNYYNNYFLKQRWDIIFYEQTSNGDRWIAYFLNGHYEYFTEISTAVYDEELLNTKVIYRLTKEALPMISNKKLNLEESYRMRKRVVIYNNWFHFNTSNFTEEAKKTIGEIAAFMQQHKEATLKITVHTDAIVSKPECAQRSQIQAQAIKKYLIEKYYLSNEKVTSLGMGSQDLIYDNDSGEGRAGNRRIEIALIK